MTPARRQEGRASPLHPEGRGEHILGVEGAPVVSLGTQGGSPLLWVPDTVPMSRVGRSQAQPPRTGHLTAPKSAPCPPSPGQTPPSSPHAGPPSSHPAPALALGPGPAKGSSLPSHPGGRIFTSLNLPWLQVLWAAASPMPRAWASECSPVADWQHEPGRREVSKHCRHFGCVCAAPQIAPCQDSIWSTSMAQPAQERWGTGHGGSHGSQGKQGVHEQERQILSVHSSVTVCGSGPRNRHRLGSCPGRQPARGVQTWGFAEEQSGKGPVRMLAQLHPCTRWPTNPDGISIGSSWHRATVAQGTAGASLKCLTILSSPKWKWHPGVPSGAVCPRVDKLHVVGR